jgi:2-dehydro-3-deoxygluconokinase
MKRVIAIGECMVELSAAEGGLLRKRYAGDAYNTAVYMKRSRPDLEVNFLTVTGSDPLSQEMRQSWAAEGVRDGLAFVDQSRRPALYLIETDARGDRRFHYWRGESAAKGWFRALQEAGGADLLAKSDLVYVSGISLAILPIDQLEPAISLFRSLKGRTRVAFDPNLRVTLWPSIASARACLETMAGVADIVLPSRQDLQDLLGEADARKQLDLLVGFGAREAALTCEGDECLVYDGRSVASLKPPAAKVVDTSGGGDSFNGGYLAARTTGADPVEAAREGLALAARVVEHPGAIIPA